MLNDGAKELVFTDGSSNNWLFNKYYYAGSNSRYWTFQAALNLLAQRVEKPIIVETGCQRMEGDLGAGMSTSIFGEYCSRYGGGVYTIDLFPKHLEICRLCTVPYAGVIQYVHSDSIEWLTNAKGVKADLLYLDSLDYPLSPDGTKSVNPAGERKSQMHCLNEFKMAEKSGVVTSKTVLLSDDNQLPGGGKPKLLKQYLLENGWICILDLQQTLWIKEI